MVLGGLQLKINQIIQINKLWKIGKKETQLSVL